MADFFNEADREAWIALRNAAPALLAVVDAARDVCASPLHTPEMEPTVVFDRLRAALTDLDEVTRA